MRRDESPLKRINPGGDVAWVARYTTHDGRRVSAGTFKKKGPCKAPKTADMRCCAQHRIYWAYEQEDRAAAAPVVVYTVRSYFEGAEPNDGWLDHHPRKERTAVGYASRVRSVLGIEIDGRPFGEWELGALRRRQLSRLVDALLREKGLAASGARVVVSVLGMMFEDAITDDLMEVNPATGIRVRESDPRVRKPRRRPVLASWEQMHHFARCAGAHEPLVRIYADCGLRLGEGLALEAAHDRRDVLVVVNNAWRAKSTPGTKQSEDDAVGREVPIPPGLRAILDAYATPLHGPLFPGPGGGFWHDRSFYRDVWYPAKAASGLLLRPHDFRHSFVSHMRAAGVDPADLAKATGQTVATATNIYTHSTGTTFDLMRRAVG